MSHVYTSNYKIQIEKGCCNLPFLPLSLFYHTFLFVLDSFDSRHMVCSVQMPVAMVVKVKVLVVVAGSDDNVRHRRRVENRVREGHVVQHRRHRHLTM